MDRVKIMPMRLFQRRNGVWYVQVDHTHKRSLGVTDPDEAIAAYNVFLEEVLKDKIRQIDNVKRITLGTFRDKYAASRGDYSDDTLRTDALAFQKLTAAFGENALLVAITPERIAAWRENLLAVVSQGSVKTWTGHLRAAFTVAIEWGYCKRNPFKGKKRGPYGTMTETQGAPDPLPPKYIPKDAFDRILEQEPREDWRRAFRLLYLTGMRRGELPRLKWEQIGEQTLTIIGKGRKVRYFPITDELRACLGTAGKPKEYVFPWRGANTITRRWKAAAKKAGYPVGITPHTLRHTFISRIAMSGAGIDVRQALAGHSTARMNLHYTHLEQEHLRKVVGCAQTAPTGPQAVEK